MAYKPPGGMTQAEIKAEIERKARSGDQLAGYKGYVDPNNLSYWQQLTSAQQSANNQGTSSTGGGGTGVPSASQGGFTGGGTGSEQPTVIYVPAAAAPGSEFVPGVTKDAVTGYGFTGIVGVGVAFVVMSLMFSFRRVRGH